MSQLYLNGQEHVPLYFLFLPQALRKAHAAVFSSEVLLGVLPHRGDMLHQWG